MSRWCTRAALAGLLVAGCAAAAPGLGQAEDQAPDQATLARGAYLAQIMDCGGCHTPGAMAGAPDTSRTLAGGTVGFKVGDLGVFFPPNLTASRATGLGDWSAADIETVLRQGVRPDGRELAPIMPWRSYSALKPADMAALVAYLQSLPPIEQATPGPLSPDEPVPLPYLTMVLPQ